MDLSTVDWENLVQRAEQMAFFHNIELYNAESSISFLIDKRDIDENISSFVSGHTVWRYEETGRFEKDEVIHLDENDLPHLAKNETYLLTPNNYHYYDAYHPQSVKYLADKAIDLIVSKQVIPERERTIASLFQISAFYGFALEEGVRVEEDAM
jgi:hypothetical protein